MKYVILGGVAAGMSAAAKIKRIQKDAEVRVFEKGGLLSYGACGLAYYVAGYNNDPALLVARTQEEFAQAGIDTLLYHEAVGVDTRGKTVTVRDLKSGVEFAESYDRLLVATGAAPIRHDIPGIDKQNIFTLKTMDDAHALKQAASSPDVKNVVVLGGGYVGVEAMEAMRAQGKHVVCVESAPRILKMFDPEISRQAQAELEENGVEVRTGETLCECGGDTHVRAVRTDRGEYPAELVVVAAGVRPSTGFLQGTGVRLAENGAVDVDRCMRTNVADVYAAGDCAMVYDSVRRANTYLPLGTLANKCGRIAGINMCGGNEEFLGTVGTSALQAFDLQMGRTGLDEQSARKLGMDVGTVMVTEPNHPAYYPGGTPITVKLVYERPSMRILGAQLCGRQGAGLRTNVFAVALQCGMTTKELGQSDLTYSPHFAGVWDVVHIACNAAK